MALPCESCGGHRWAAEGYCLEIECAGHYLDPDYPRSKPDHLKQRDALRRGTEEKKKRSKAKKVRMPPKGTRRAIELQYEALGEIAPWLEKTDDDHA